MKIGIDARLFGAYHRGLGRYTQQLLEHLEKVDQENEYVVFLNRDGFDAYQPKNPRFKKVLADCRVYGWKEQFVLPRLINKQRLDLVHFTHFNAPIFFGGEFVATIHDLTLWHYPDRRSSRLPLIFFAAKLFFYRLVMRRTAKKAKHLIVVSQFVKDDVVRNLGIAPKKIVVVYEGFDQVCSTDSDEKPFGENYLLYVGAAYPHKNLEVLISAFSQIVDKFNDLRLVIVGRRDFFHEKLMEQARKKLSSETFKKIIFAGGLDDRALSAAYQNAKIFIFPSYSEGFGLPALEAQSCGLPVIAAEAGALPEILGESAIYFPAANPVALAEIIQELLFSPEKIADLKTRGLENIKKFSWEKAAKETLLTYFL